MTATTLVLDSTHIPHRFVTWRKAVQLLVKGKAEIISLYDETLQNVSREFADALDGIEHEDSDMYTVRVPMVIKLFRKIPRKNAVKFSRINVLTRDNWTCQYCGKKKRSKDLNYDHVIPRSQGGQTTWRNIVMSCYPCNYKKSGRTPSQAGMVLIKKPVCPDWLPVAMLRVDELREIPECFKSWLYWTVELEP